MRAWQTAIADGMEYVEVKEDSKTVIIHGWKGYWKNDSGNSTSFENFLDGEFHDWIREYHGEKVLEQVVAHVKHCISKD